jgi:hypothetical protein
MAGIDMQQLVNDMKTAASGVLNKDVSTLRGFAESQLTAIAQQTDNVAAGIADKSITPDLQDYFLDSLEEMARSFANTLAGLVSVLIEQVWNAVVGVIWKAINGATGLALAVP